MIGKAHKVVLSMKMAKRVSLSWPTSIYRAPKVTCPMPPLTQLLLTDWTRYRVPPDASGHQRPIAYSTPHVLAI
jgi:hypothetical protein